MELQAQILIWFEGIRTDFLTLFFTTVTIFAEKTFIVFLLSVLYWCIDKVKSKRLAWFVLFGAASNGIIKNIVRMPRPYEVAVVKPLRVETATSYSFPSGHTQSAVSFWAGSMVILKTKASIILGSIMIGLTMISRLYLGVHWPMDVIGGLGFGLICIYFANQLLDETSKINKYHVLGTTIICLGALILDWDHDFYSAAGALWGFSIGCYLEQRYVQFKMSHSLKNNLWRVVIGVMGILICYIGIGKLLPDIKVMSILKNALVTVWISLGAPYIFNKFLKDE